MCNPPPEMRSPSPSLSPTSKPATIPRVFPIPRAKATAPPPETLECSPAAQTGDESKGFPGRGITRAILVAIGTSSLALGIAGILLPILPTTPFLLLAAACYARSSRRFHNWLTSNRFFGEYLGNYLERRGIPLRVKVLSIALLWITIGCSAALAVDALWLRVLLAAIAVGVTAHTLSLRTLTR
jgi:uncharacterized membrane protein YbaN (DUF454 family)